MKLLGIRNLFVSLGLGAMLMFGAAATVSAATEAVLTQCTEPEAEVPQIVLDEDNIFDVPAAELSTSDRVSIRQYAATTNSFTFQWNVLSDATSYEVAVGPYKAREDHLFKKFPSVKPATGQRYIARKIQGPDLESGTPYTVRIRAFKGSQASSYTYLTCFTLYDKLTLPVPTYKNKVFTFKPSPTKKPAPAKTYNFISGYNVYYYSYRTGKTVKKEYDNRYEFAIKPSLNSFYKVTVIPLSLN